MVSKIHFSRFIPVLNHGLDRLGGKEADEEKRSSSDLSAVGPHVLSILTGNQMREKLQNWLSPPDPSINHNIARKVHHEGTATWFFQGSIFKDWKSSPSLLWVHGKRTSLFPSTTSPTHPMLLSW
jgi:hypothetical protein